MNLVNFGGTTWATPQGTSPMMFYYREDLFKQFGLEVPKTWEDFAATAKKLHAADATRQLATFPTGDPGLFAALIGAGGLRPPSLGVAADFDARFGAGEGDALQIALRRGGNAREQPGDGHHRRDGGCQVTTIEHEMRPPGLVFKRCRVFATSRAVHHPSSDESRR